MGYKLFGVDTEGVPMHLIKSLRATATVDVFVECGTAGGESIRKAAPYFKECHTIELIPGRTHIDRTITNIKWYTGHSVDILKRLVKRFCDYKSDNNLEYRYILFFLDAHYSDSIPNASKYKECYIPEELEAIAPYNENAIIFIDDARLFLGRPVAPHNPADWPGVQDIFIMLKNLYPNSYATITDDYIIVIPNPLRYIFDHEWQSRFYARYPSERERLRLQAKAVYDSFENG